jgi:hypothetical protein
MRASILNTGGEACTFGTFAQGCHIDSFAVRRVSKYMNVDNCVGRHQLYPLTSDRSRPELKSELESFTNLQFKCRDIAIYHHFLYMILIFHRIFLSALHIAIYHHFLYRFLIFHRISNDSSLNLVTHI